MGNSGGIGNLNFQGLKLRWAAGFGGLYASLLYPLQIRAHCIPTMRPLDYVRTSNMLAILISHHTFRTGPAAKGTDTAV